MGTTYAIQEYDSLTKKWKHYARIPPSVTAEQALEMFRETKKRDATIEGGIRLVQTAVTTIEYIDTPPEQQTE